MKTREVPLEFVGTGQVKGFKFKAVYISDPYRIYEVDSGDTIYYEAVKIRKTRAVDSHSNHRDYDFVEYYPGQSKFGIDGFCCMTISKAHFYVDKMKKEAEDYRKQIGSN